MSDYSAQSIQILKGLEAVRVRPGMYIGSTGPDGLHHLVYEVVDNSIDEALAGHCTWVKVIIEKDNIIRVEDDGRGIPVDIHPEEGLSALEVVMTKLHAGGKFDKDSYAVSGGLHGVGVSVVNALSEWLEAKVYREGKIYTQCFDRGITRHELQHLGDTEKKGTTIRFKADDQIFTETTAYSFDVLVARLRELAFLNKGIKIIIVDDRKETPITREFHFEGGVKEFVSYLSQNKAVIHNEPIYFEIENDNVRMEISLQYNNDINEITYSFVNNINTREGGTHLTGFRTALTRVINNFVKDSRHLKKLSEGALTSDDVREGLVAIISIKIANPQFEGQTKQKLGNNEVKGAVDSAVYERLTAFFEAEPKVIDIILENACNAANARLAARKARDLARRKSVLGGSGLPDKLADCSDKDPASCELFIVEGDSAGGSAKEGRDRRTQAILPLWGKMLNVEKTRLEKVIDNEKLLPVILALGAGIGDDFDVEKLRYHKIIIMADADVDGSHIRTLMLTFFFRYMAKLVEGGFVYIANPPLYKVSKGKKHFYAFSDDERDAVVKAEGSDDIMRYKGLGEMNSEELGETTMNKENRSLTRVTMQDAIEADKWFTILMGDQVPPRRQFIEENAAYAINLDI